MKNRISRLISLAVMIALLLTSCVIPMSAMADGIEEDYSVDAYRFVTRTKTVIANTYTGPRKSLGMWANHDNSPKTIKRTYKLSNKWTLSLGKNAKKNNCKGLPGNYGEACSINTYNVSVKPRFAIRFYATEKRFNGLWEHTKQRQVRKAYTTEWIDTKDEPEVSYSTATGTWHVFGSETFRE